MSPATDFGTMYLVFFIVTLWTSIACEKEGKVGEKTDLYALLCVAVVCVTTFKLSAGMLVILALYPAVCLCCACAVAGAECADFRMADLSVSSN